MNEIKKLGDNIKLKGLIIHQVNKEAGYTNVVLKLAENVLSISDKEKVFIARIYKSYFDTSKPIYGIFDNQDPKFQNDLQDYLTHNNLIEFSKKATNHFKTHIKSVPPATGGFLIFAHFENLDKKFDYMLVMTITNKDGFMVREDNLSLEDIKNLDLSKIDVACMINLTNWQQIKDGTNNENSTYLSFAKGAKEVSRYFMSFIDCDNKTTKAESTKRLMYAFDEYCKINKYERDIVIKLKNCIVEYCLNKLGENKEVHLSAISALVNPENSNDFENFASDEIYSVNHIINIDKSKIRTLKYISYKDKKMTVEFDSSLLNRDVIFDDETKTLTFIDIPEKLASQIR